jgi:hypothetical protein
MLVPFVALLGIIGAATAEPPCSRPQLKSLLDSKVATLLGPTVALDASSFFVIDTTLCQAAMYAITFGTPMPSPPYERHYAVRVKATPSNRWMQNLHRLKYVLFGGPPRGRGPPFNGPPHPKSIPGLPYNFSTTVPRRYDEYRNVLQIPVDREELKKDVLKLYQPPWASSEQWIKIANFDFLLDKTFGTAFVHYAYHWDPRWHPTEVSIMDQFVSLEKGSPASHTFIRTIVPDNKIDLYDGLSGPLIHNETELLTVFETQPTVLCQDGKTWATDLECFRKNPSTWKPLGSPGRPKVPVS